jgi:hypothetical protein
LTNVKPEFFKAQEENVNDQDEDDDKEYDEGDEVEELEDTIISQYNLIDESDVVYGTKIYDIIKAFKCAVLPSKKVIGLDVSDLYYKNRESMIDYVTSKVCDENEDGSMEVVLLTNSNVLNRTGIYVKDINEVELMDKMGVK